MVAVLNPVMTFSVSFWEELNPADSRSACDQNGCVVNTPNLDAACLSWCDIVGNAKARVVAEAKCVQSVPSTLILCANELLTWQLCAG